MNDTIVSLVWKCIRIAANAAAHGNLTEEQRHVVVTIAKYMINRHPS